MRNAIHSANFYHETRVSISTIMRVISINAISIRISKAARMHTFSITKASAAHLDGLSRLDVQVPQVNFGKS